MPPSIDVAAPCAQFTGIREYWGLAAPLVGVDLMVLSSDFCLPGIIGSVNCMQCWALRSCFACFAV